MTKTYASQPPVTALRGVSFTVRRGRAGRDRRPVRFREDHAAARDRHPGPAQLRAGAHHRAGRGTPVRPGAGHAARHPDRVRVPAVLPRRTRSPCWTTSPTGSSTPASATASRRDHAATRSPRSASATDSTPDPPNSPAGNASAWPSPGPWSANRPSCWPTSPPATSTAPPGSRSSPCSTTSTAPAPPSS